MGFLADSMSKVYIGVVDGLGSVDSLLKMRSAQAYDSEQLLAWRNLGEVRMFAKNTGEISSNTHINWYLTRITKTEEIGPIFIFEIKNSKIGMSRLDRKGTQFFEISILVSPEYQKKGYGIKMLNMTVRHAFSSLAASGLRAHIHHQNLASESLFKKAGFKKSNRKVLEDKFVEFELSLSEHFK
jgi:RimJ/RimL family protein N-acetyltransferase